MASAAHSSAPGDVAGRRRHAHERLQLALGHQRQASGGLDHGRRGADRLREVVARDAQAGVEVEPVRVLALRPDPGVEVELAAAEPLRLGRAPLEQRPPVAAPAAVRVRREVVDVQAVAPGEVVDHPEAGHGDAAPVLEDAHEPVALGPLDLVDAPDELGLVVVVACAERASPRRRARGVAAEGSPVQLPRVPGARAPVSPSGTTGRRCRRRRSRATRAGARPS